MWKEGEKALNTDKKKKLHNSNSTEKKSHIYSNSNF